MWPNFYIIHKYIFFICIIVHTAYIWFINGLSLQKQCNK